MGNEELSGLREEITAIDRQIIELAGRRAALAARVGQAKDIENRPIRDFTREKDVVSRARRIAAEAGVSETLAENLMLELIRSSLTVQERGRVQSVSTGTGRSAVVVGGLGRMGQWFVRFLESQGFAVSIADPKAEDAGFRSWDSSSGPFDIYVLATPIPVTATILEEMVEDPPPGLVFDISSLKTPLRDGLEALAATGARVTSIHPMFGATTDLLSGRHVVIVDVGNSEATEEARELFTSTMASLVDMDLDSHDRLIAYILGLSHAVNIAFFTALSESGEEASRLAALSSTTFDRQLAVAAQVAGENPHLYFEIQYLNQYGDASLASLADAVQRLRELVEAGDTAGFADLMEGGASYLAETMGD